MYSKKKNEVYIKTGLYKKKKYVYLWTKKKYRKLFTLRVLHF